MAIETTSKTEGPPRHQRDRRPIVAVVVFLTLMVALTAGIVILARDGGGKTAVGPSRSAPAGSTQTTLSAQQRLEKDVIDAYRAFERAFDEASKIPDPVSPALLATVTGNAKQVVQSTLEAWRATGVVAQDPPGGGHRIVSTEVVSLEQETAVLRVCDVDDGTIVKVRQGEVDDGVPVGTVIDNEVVTLLSRVTLKREDGRWRTFAIDVERQWEGVAGCAA